MSLEGALACTKQEQETNVKKKKRQREEWLQWVNKVLVRQVLGLTSSHRTLHKKLDMALSRWDRWIPGTLGPASVVELASSRFRERETLSQKIRWREAEEDIRR